MIAMRTMLRAALAIGLTLLLVPSRAISAASGTAIAVLRLDPANTQINFMLKGFPHNTEGSFKLKSGEIRVDPATGGSEGAIVVDAASGETGIGMRDSQMKDHILEVQRYPEVSFRPRHAEGRPALQGDFTVTVRGVMSLHGSQHEMNLEVAIHRSKDDFTAVAHFTIPYVQWGLTNPSVLFLTVSDEVAIDFSTAGHVTWLPDGGTGAGAGQPR
jgi:polyisoprenoid-binding protein YceI